MGEKRKFFIRMVVKNNPETEEANRSTSLGKQQKRLKIGSYFVSGKDKKSVETGLPQECYFAIRGDRKQGCVRMGNAFRMNVGDEGSSGNGGMGEEGKRGRSTVKG